MSRIIKLRPTSDFHRILARDPEQRHLGPSDSTDELSVDIVIEPPELVSLAGVLKGFPNLRAHLEKETGLFLLSLAATLQPHADPKINRNISFLGVNISIAPDCFFTQQDSMPWPLAPAGLLHGQLLASGKILKRSERSDLRVTPSSTIHQFLSSCEEVGPSLLGRDESQPGHIARIEMTNAMACVNSYGAGRSIFGWEFGRDWAHDDHPVTIQMLSSLLGPDSAKSFVMRGTAFVTLCPRGTAIFALEGEIPDWTITTIPLRPAP